MMKNEVKQTDLTRWRLSVDSGRHTWNYLSVDESVNARPQTIAERYFLGLETNFTKFALAKSPKGAAENGLRFLRSIQLDDGHWGCAYGGPCFLTPAILFSMYITETAIPEEWAIEISRHLVAIVNPDGGWGMHCDGPSTVLATSMHYVTLRILGMGKDHEVICKARECLKHLGGAESVPQWGKIWFSLLNIYPWEAMNPIPSELWYFPDWLPVHPWRWWVHCRWVYLPSSYLYSQRFRMALNPVLESLRSELYCRKYTSITWSNRDNVARSDLKSPTSILLRGANFGLMVFDEYMCPSWLRERANRHVLHLIEREDENTDYNDLAPVNKALNMVAVYASEGNSSHRLQRHRDTITNYLWMGASGIRCGGTNGAQVWDIAFIIHAAIDSGLAKLPEFRPTLDSALRFLASMQLEGDLNDPYRQPRHGGWPFSTKDNGYIVSDCTAESLQCVLILQYELGFEEHIPARRLQDAVDTLLKMQNPHGGIGTYEITRGSTFLMKLLNPAEIFDSSIMIEDSHVECTSAVLIGLKRFSKYFPQYRRNEVEHAISKAASYIRSVQRSDGSWYGSWGVCFTYAAQFALGALGELGETYDSSGRVKKCCEFLVQQQHADGGWGEHWTSCETGVYTQHEESQVVQTAWVIIALMHARYPKRSVIDDAVKLLMKRQQANGEWPQEQVEGVFNKTCMIGYPNYRLCFPIRALGMYHRLYVNAGEQSEKPEKCPEADSVHLSATVFPTQYSSNALYERLKFFSFFAVICIAVTIFYGTVQR